MLWQCRATSWSSLAKQPADSLNSSSPGHIMYRHAIKLALLLLSACASQHFTQSNPNAAARAALPPDCPITLISQAPAAGTYVELGLCDVAVPGGGLVADYSYKATAKLRACACAAGGNTVLYLDGREGNVPTVFGSSQQRVSAKGAVLWVDAPTP